MSRKLEEIRAEGDAQVFAENVNRRRRAVGLSLRALSQLSGVHTKTLVNIEKGNGCTPPIELKLSKALQVVQGSLWKAPVYLQYKPYNLCNVGDARWHFLNLDQCHKYLLVHGLVDSKQTFRQDPDEIQDEAERLRLGRNGLSDGFLLVTSRNITSYAISSCMHECYRPAPFGLHEDMITFHHCCRGELRYVIDGEEMIIREGGSMVFERSFEGRFEPVTPIGQTDLPPIISVCSIIRWAPTFKNQPANKKVRAKRQA